MYFCYYVFKNTESFDRKSLDGGNYALIFNMAASTRSVRSRHEVDWFLAPCSRNRGLSFPGEPIFQAADSRGGWRFSHDQQSSSFLPQTAHTDCWNEQRSNRWDHRLLVPVRFSYPRFDWVFFFLVQNSICTCKYFEARRCHACAKDQKLLIRILKFRSAKWWNRHTNSNLWLCIYLDVSSNDLVKLVRLSICVSNCVSYSAAVFPANLII